MSPSVNAVRNVARAAKPTLTREARLGLIAERANFIDKTGVERLIPVSKKEIMALDLGTIEPLNDGLPKIPRFIYPS